MKIRVKEKKPRFALLFGAKEIRQLHDAMAIVSSYVEVSDARTKGFDDLFLTVQRICEKWDL